MTEMKASNLTSLVSKKARRAKARLMQNLGKGPDRTEDEIFEVYQSNFFRQYNSATRLHKELKNFTNCLRAMHEARQSLNECLLELHEKEWTKHRVVEENIIEMEYIGDNLLEKFRESIMVPVEQYLSQFGEVRDKIAKRGRKLVDYDQSRHNYDALVSSVISSSSNHSSSINTANIVTQRNKSTSDDVKLTKARDQMEECKRVYETLNSELHDELPALYDNRLSLIISVLQRLYTAELSYHTQSVQVFKNLNEAVEQLAAKAQRGIYNMSARQDLSLNSSPTVPQSTVETAADRQVINGNDGDSDVIQSQSNISTVNDSISTAIPSRQSVNSAVVTATNRVSYAPVSTSIPISDPVSVSGANNDQTTVIPKQTQATVSNQNSESVKRLSGHNEQDSSVNGDENKNENGSSSGAAVAPETTGEIVIPENATLTDLPPGVLYCVKASYKYMAEDIDELSFEAGETIQVVNYNDPAEQEDGWLMGIRELNGKKGLFPANFTRVI